MVESDSPLARGVVIVAVLVAHLALAPVVAVAWVAVVAWEAAADQWGRQR